MTTALSNFYPNLSDYAKSLDPDGKIAKVINLMSQRNDILDDIPFVEGNLEVGHQVTQLTGLPTIAYRLLNAGIVPSKETKAQIIEQTGMAENYAQVDVDLAKRSGNVAAYRASKAGPVMEAFAQAFTYRLIYGNVGTAPAEFTGLAPRFSSLSAGNAQNIIDGGGSGSDNTSIWLVAWGEDAVYGIFPKGSTGGLNHEDLGLQVIQNANNVTGALMTAYVDHWQWKHGLCLADWRFAVRICNIDVSDLIAGTGTNPDLVALMERAEELLPNGMGKRAFYMNRTARRMLRKQARTNVTTGGGLTFENYAGKRILMFDESPVRLIDQIVNTEARIT